MTLKKSALLTFCFITTLMTAHYTAQGSLLSLVTLVVATCSLFAFLNGYASLAASYLISVALLTGLSTLMGLKAGLPFGESIFLLSAAVFFFGVKALNLKPTAVGKKIDKGFSTSIVSASGGSSVKKG